MCFCLLIVIVSMLEIARNASLNRNYTKFNGPSITNVST